MAPASVLTRTVRTPEPIEASEARDLVEQLNESLEYAAAGVAGLHLRVQDEATDVELPSYLIEFVTGVLEQIAQGNAVVVGGLEPELTTQQAADTLRVSRPYLIKLVDEGRLPHRRVGNRRKILLADVLDYQRRDDAERRRVLDELTHEAEELELDY